MSSRITGTREQWGSRIGLILAMAGNAVGLGNFLRFPRQAVLNGGGAFLIPYFVALLLLGIPLMWIEWGIGRNAGRYRKGHVPGMFAVLWKHPVAKYLGVLGLVIPFSMLVYYTYIESWTLAYTWFSATGAYWGRSEPSEMVTYLQTYQGVVGGAFPWSAVFFFAVTLGVNIYVVARGITHGIERLARIGMPVLLVAAVILVVVVLSLGPGVGGETALDGLEFMYTPDFSRLSDAGVWLAAAGQIFFTLSVGMGTLQAYASYLSRKDDILLSGLATSATNESVEVVLGGTIAIPAAVVFFGVSGAVAVAQSGSFNLGFATMPVIFQQLAGGRLLGFLWFGLLFFAGITSSVAMATPIVAFFREEFGVSREKAAWTLGAVAFALGLMHIAWLSKGFLDEWDYWAGTFGLSAFAVVEVVLFLWVFGPENAWKSMHEGADIRLPRIVKGIMTWVTPMYLIVLFTWWGATEALPILLVHQSPDGGPVPAESIPYVWLSRAIMLAAAAVFAVLVRKAWIRNGYVDADGLPEVVDLEVKTK